MAEKSSILLITVSRVSPQFLIVSMYPRCSLLRAVVSRREVMPIIPFMGVRISWDILVRKKLLARRASSVRRAC
jgi:hypothetical protein